MENNLNKKSYLSGNIKYIRKKNKLNQTELARLLDKKTSVISAYEKGDTTPPLEIILLLSDTFGISVSDLIESDLNEKQFIINDTTKKIIELNNKFGWENKTSSLNLSSNEIILTVIESNLFRINEVKHLIEAIADENKFKKDKIFSTYNSTIQQNKLEDFIKTYNLKSFEELSNDFIETFSKAVNQALFSIYSDLFNIVNFQTFINNKK